MKSLVLKWMAVMLVLAMAFPAFAEEFALRSGIQFGDTFETICEKEKTLKHTEGNIFEGKIAGYDNAVCSFFFDDNEKLVSMNYCFDSRVCKTKDEMNDVYKTLYQSLKRKYGNPEGNTGGACELITGPAFDRMSVIVYLFGQVDGCSADYVDYDEWIVDCGNYKVKIDMVSYYYRDAKYNYQYYVDVSYHKYTDEDYNEAVRKKQGEREEVDNDM